MSGKSWYASETKAETVEEKHEAPEHILLREVELDAGHKVPWIIKTVILYLFFAGFVIFSCELTIELSNDFGFNGLFIRLFEIASLFVFWLPALLSRCWFIATQTFVCHGVYVNDIDLRQIKCIWYGWHCLYLDKYVLDYVPNPFKLYKNLDEYYFNITGGYLP